MSGPGDQLVEEPRPWERPGAVRRDCRPHRGNVLVLLATVALLLGLSSFCLVIPGWAALPLGMTVDWLARRDLACMAAGTMDPRGAAEAERARGLAGSACALAVFGGLLFGLPLATWLLRMF